MVSSKKFVKNMIWSLLERSGAEIVTFIVSIVLARLLDPTVYGTIALITVITTILQVFVESGFGSALIQKKDADDLDFSTVFYFNVVMCLCLYALLYFCAPFIANFYEMPELTDVIRVLGIMIIISGLKNIQQSYVAKKMLFKKFFFSTLGGTITAAVVGIYMAIKGYGVWALVAQHLANVTVGTIILWFTVKWRPKWAFSFKRLKSLFSYGWKLLVASLIETIYNDIRQLIIGKQYSSEDLAFYNKGKQFPHFIVSNINSSIKSVLFPTMAEAQNDKGAVKAMTRRAIKTSSFIMWPMMIGLAVCAEPFIAILLTEKWLFCVPYLQVFCLLYTFYPIHTANLNAIKAMGKSDIYLKLEVIKKVVGVIALVISMWISPFAMACSLLITTVISGFINAFPNKKLLNYSFLEQIKDMLPATGLALLMGGVVSLVYLLDLNYILTLIIQVPLGVVVYFVLAKLFKMESFEYLLNLLKKFFKKDNKAKETTIKEDFTNKDLTEKQIINFLIKVDKDFPVALSNKVSLEEYALKLKTKANIFTKVENGEILSMVAGYIDNATDEIAYASLLATVKDSRGKGYAKELLEKFIADAKQKGIKAVHLYTTKNNEKAVSLYTKLGFTEYIVENEDRPNDLHLILRFKGE